MKALLLLPLLACSGGKYECESDAGCGFGETCVEGRCSGKACATSAQCPMEMHCENGECRAGCADDADCYAGDSCDLAEETCVTAACLDSRTDCGFQEFCNTATGECYDAAGYYCATCNDDDDCGGNGNLCLDLGYADANFCGVTCESEDDCPNGYTCVGVGDLSGNIIAYQCITYCWLYETNARTVQPGATP